MSTFLWMFFVLKIPICLLLWLVWYASRPPEPVTDEESDEGGGSDRDPHRSPKLPRPPRRGGPHGAPPPTGPPSRVRVPARARRLTR